MMSQMLRRIQLPLIGIVLLGLFIGVFLVACKRFTKKSDSAENVVKHTIKTPARDVLKYWTADKMHGARGVDLPQVDVTEQGQRPAHKPGSHQD
jgi:hypothetical protein